MHTKSASVVLSVLLAVAASVAQGGTVNISLVTVGDAGNVADPMTGYGAVPYVYQMGEYDVTVGQYTAFLNSVATSGDPFGLYNQKMGTSFRTYGIIQASTSAGYAYSVKGGTSAAAFNVPVTNITWGDAARFVNWLANGQPTAPEGPGTTETGTYALNGAKTAEALLAVTRSSTAGWVIPTPDEWYKAAYYKGGGLNAGYWEYPTQNDYPPSNVLSATGTNNANFTNPGGGPSSDPVNGLTPVGAFAASPGPYGTYDQGGDVEQWTEDSLPCGGGFAGVQGAFAKSIPAGIPDPTLVGPTLGFRVAYVPEPNTAAMLLAAMLSIWCFARRHCSKKQRG